MTTLKTILYFSIFNYPITKEEIFKYSEVKDSAELDRELEQLLFEKKIYCIEGYYLPIKDESWVARRVRGNDLAVTKMKKALKMAHILIKFPYTRAVMISGTLSKGFMDINDDIDFFVITKPGNLVISKFFMGVFRRLFATRSFCVNYIVDWNHLKIQKANYYYAIEMATLIPVINSNLYQQFISSNTDLMFKYLPNWEISSQYAPELKNGLLKNCLEKLLSITLFLNLGKLLQRFYLKRLGTKTIVNKKSLITNELTINDGVFKGHNLGYASKILNIYTSYINDINKNSELQITQHFYD